MANINNIQNNETGLSVRNKLNNLIAKAQATSGSLNVLSASFEDLSGSFVTDSGSFESRLTNASASVASLSSSFELVSASFQEVSASFVELSSSFMSGSFSGSFHGDGSRVTGVVSASYATTASILNHDSNTFEVHVDTQKGEDKVGHGTLLYPYKTINYALGQVGTGHRIIVHRGQYNENINLVDTNTSIIGYEGGNGALVEITGTLTVNVAAPSSTRISNIRVSTLVHTNTGGLYLNNVIVYTQATLNGVYFEASDCRMECSGGISKTTAGTVFVQNSTFYPIVVNHSSAVVYLKNLITTVQPTVTAGTLAIVDSLIYPAVSGTPAIVSSAGSTVSLVNSQITNTSGVPQKVNIGGFFTYVNSTFERAGSNLGTVVDTIARFTDIHTGKLTVSGSSSVSGDFVVGGKLTAREIFTQYESASVIYSSGSTKFGDTLDDTHQFTGSVQISGSISVDGDFSSSFATTSSYALTSSVAESASFASTASYVASASYIPNLQQVTSKDGLTSASVTIQGSSANGFSTASFNQGEFRIAGENTTNGITYTAVLNRETTQGGETIFNVRKEISGSADTTAVFEHYSDNYKWSLEDNLSGISASIDANIQGTGSVINIAADQVNISGELNATASYASTASYVESASFALSSSYATTASYVQSASFAESASYSVTSSHSISGSYALTASYALNGGGGGASVIISASAPVSESKGTLWFNTDSDSANGGELYILMDETSSNWIPVIDNYVDQAVTASFATTASFAQTTPSIDYLFFKGTGTQTVAQGDIVTLWDDAGGYNQGGITYNNANGQFTLKAGKKYELESSYYATSWSNTTAGFLWIGWNLVSGTGIFIEGDSTVVPSTHTTDRSSAPVLKAFVAPTTDIVVSIRVDLATGNAILQGSRSYAVIKEIR